MKVEFCIQVPGLGWEKIVQGAEERMLSKILSDKTFLSHKTPVRQCKSSDGKGGMKVD